MKKIKFEHRKPFYNLQGETVTMKALITIHGKNFIEVHENEIRYSPDELTEIENFQQISTLDEIMKPYQFNPPNHQKL